MKKRTQTQKKSTIRRRKQNFDFGTLENRKLMASLTSSTCDSISVQVPDEAQQVQIADLASQNDNLGILDGIQRIVNGEQTDEFEAVGVVGPLGCTGALISPTHVLTAAHCFDGGVNRNSATFEVNGQTYRGTYTRHPGYNESDFGAGSDLAIIELDRPVEGVTPLQLFRQTPQVGMDLTLVGFGEGGTSTGGFDASDDGKQVGQTRLDDVTAQHIAWNFDSHNEANTAPGDSGGPALVQVNGQFQIIGVTSGGTGDAHTLGDYSFDTRIDIHADWIDGLVGNDGGGGGDDGGGDGGGDDGGGDDGGGDDGGGDDGGGDDDGGGNGQDDHADGPGPDASKINLGGNNTGTGTGTLEVEGDRDAFSFDIGESGQTEISLRGTGADAGLDTYLRIYDSQGSLIAQNDDFGGELSSTVRISLDAGRYFAVAGSYADSEAGDFRLEVSHTPDTTGDSGSQTFENNQTKTISDIGRDRVASSINVRGVQGEISDINVTVDIDHTWTSDLRLVLVAPNGQRTVLVNRQGDDGDNFEGTVFDTQGSQHINHGDAPFRGTFRPAHSLNRLNGAQANGRWRLVVIDFADGDGGSLDGWKIDIATEGSRNQKKSIAASRVDSSEASQRLDSERVQNFATRDARPAFALAGHVEASGSQGQSEVHNEVERGDGSSDATATREGRLSLLDSVFGDQWPA